MQAIIDLPGPSNTPSSVRQFYDAIESHIRSLTALGWTKDSYGSLLTTILLGKIPGKMKQDMARANGKWEWTITDLCTSIHDELYIIEIGSHIEPNAALPPTASFHSGVSKPAHDKERYSAPSARGPTLLHCVNKSLTLDNVPT